jgi:hypothetical protein
MQLGNTTDCPWKVASELKVRHKQSSPWKPFP